MRVARFQRVCGIYDLGRSSCLTRTGQYWKQDAGDDRAMLRYPAPVKVRVLYFAVLRDLVGRGEDEMELEEGATAGSFWEHLRAETAALAGWSTPPLLAINEFYAAPDVELREGDVLALIPPVAGG